MYKTTNFKAQTPVYASTVVVKTVSAIWNYCHLNVTSQTCPLCYTHNKLLFKDKKTLIYCMLLFTNFVDL